MTAVTVRENVIIESPKFYQAIGDLYGKIFLKEEDKKFYIRLRDGSEYGIVLDKRQVKLLARQIESSPMLWLKVYPQFHLASETIYFKVVAWSQEKFADTSEENIFIFRGIFQFIPQRKRPVFSIYRNRVKEGGRAKNKHLPFLWKGDDNSFQKAFKFSKNGKDKPVFYEVKAKLIPRLNTFGFIEMIAEPSKKLPKKARGKLSAPLLIN